MAGAITQERASCQFPFVLDEKPILDRSARPESGREASEKFLSRLLELRASGIVGLAGGFRSLRLFGIDRLDAPVHAAER
jgi:hypothetical protein